MRQSKEESDEAIFLDARKEEKKMIDPLYLGLENEPRLARTSTLRVIDYTCRKNFSYVTVQIR